MTGWKAHMNGEHKGFTEAQLAVMLKQVDSYETAPTIPAEKIPGFKQHEASTEREPSEEQATQRPTEKRPRTGKEDRRAIALERIGKPTCWFLAGAPYTAVASIMGDPRWKLTQTEQEDIATAYIQFCEAFEIDFSGKIAAIAAIITVNADAIAARAALLMPPGQPQPAQKPPTILTPERPGDKLA